MRLPPLAYLCSALVLLASSSAVVKWLVQNGTNLGLSRPDAISFCNVLFVGNACAGLVVLARVGPRPLLAEWRQTTRRVRGLMLANSLFSVFAASLFFQALEQTSVANLVLLGRIEPPMYALLSVLFLGAKITKAQWAGQGLIVVGVLVLVLVQGMGQFNRGDLQVMIAACLVAVSGCLGKRLLEGAGVSLFICVRTFCSALIFFSIAVYLFGFHHFKDAFGAELWGMMLIYALLIVVTGQFCWFRALSQLPAATIANWSMLSPIVGIGMGYLLLAEAPSGTQWVAGLIILAGMAVSQIRARESRPESGLTERALAGA